MSGDPEQEYFADGMVEEIITALPSYPLAVRRAVHSPSAGLEHTDQDCTDLLCRTVGLHHEFRKLIGGKNMHAT